jgi:hypothetical protein
MSSKKQSAPTARSQAIYSRIVIEGCDPETIAKEFNISLSQLHKIVSQVRTWIRRATSGLLITTSEKETSENILEDKVNVTLLELRKLHLARLEHQWEQVMLGWYRSLQVEETEKVVGDEKGHRKAEKIRRTQTGDVAYLEQARKIMQEMRALFPLQSTDTAHEENNHVENLTLEQREIAIDNLLETIRQRAGETTFARTSARKESAA